MYTALIRLGLSQLAATEFIHNGITNMNWWRSLTKAALDRLIKQIHRDNQGASLFIPFASQQYIHAIRFWANCMHIICAPYDVNNVNEPLAEMWNESMKVEKEAMEALDTWNFQERYKVETMERKSPHLPRLQERSSQHPFGIHHQRKWCASSWDHICSCAWSAGWSRHPPWPQVQRQQRDHLWPIAVSQFKWPSMVM